MPIETVKIDANAVLNGGDTQIGAGVELRRDADGVMRGTALQGNVTQETGFTTQAFVRPTVGLSDSAVGVQVGLEPTPLRPVKVEGLQTYTFPDGSQTTFEALGFTNGAARPVRDSVTLGVQATLSREALSDDPRLTATPVLGAALSVVEGRGVQGRLEAGARLAGDPVSASVSDGSSVPPLRGANGVTVTGVIEANRDGVSGRIGNGTTFADEVGAARQPLPTARPGTSPTDEVAANALRASPLYQQALSQLNPSGAPVPADSPTDRVAAAIAVQGARDGLSRVSALVPGQQGDAAGHRSVLFVLDGDPANPASQRVAVDRFRAETVPVADSARQFAGLNPAAPPPGAALTETLQQEPQRRMP